MESWEEDWSDDEKLETQGHVHHGNCCTHDHSDEIQVYNLPVETKLAACDAFRMEAHCYYRESQFLRARARFQKMIVYLDYTFPDTPEEEARASVLRRTALTNMALCSFLADEFRQAINYSDQVIRDWPEHIKAHLCRAKAFRSLGEFKEAWVSMNRCLALAPRNRTILVESKILESDERCYRLDSEKVAKGMFSSSTATTEASESLGGEFPAAQRLNYTFGD